MQDITQIARGKVPPKNFDKKNESLFPYTQ